jgi:competence protein ComEA
MSDISEPPEGPGGLPATWRERIELLTGGAPLRPTPGQIAAAVVVVLAAAAALFVWLRPSAPPPELSIPMAPGAAAGGASPTEATAGPAAEGDVYAHAAGAVARPGVYRLAPGSRVTDLVDAAGGLAADAAPDHLNLAAPVTDGQQVYVPRVGEAAPPGPPGASTPAGPLDLNTATADELDELPGVGPATAQAILDHRERNGPFRAVEELLEVRGIGEAKLEALRDLVRV